jgi:hypothetical protein
MQRKKHSPDFKPKVALEALKGLKTVNQKLLKKATVSTWAVWGKKSKGCNFVIS